MPFDIKEFGRRLKQARTAADLTQDALAGLIAAPGKNPRTWISELENGRQESLRAATVVRFAEALNVSADYLLGLTNDPSVRARVPAGVVSLFGRWKGQLPPDFDAHFDDLDGEITRLFEGEEDDGAAAR